MYIKSIEISNLKSFALLNWKLDADTTAQGWHVIVGANGSGKSTILRGIALSLMPAKQIFAARLDLPQYVRFKSDKTEIDLTITRDTKFDPIPLKSNFHIDLPDEIKNKINFIKFSLNIYKDGSVSVSPIIDNQQETKWKLSSEGWFSSGFGPLRRFSGGNLELNRHMSNYPILYRHISLFGEDVALIESLEWLRLLKFKKLESKEEYTLIDHIKEFLNQDGFLPFGAKLLDITSDNIIFCDGNGVKIPVLDLSDGYRSILSLTFELIRLMSSCYPNIELFNQDNSSIVVPGVVLIDEVDAHLHPNWQRAIGPWLCRLFPQIQFIVTTHSTFVCQEATSIWRLPDPGTNDEFKRVTGEELTRLKYGDATLALETHAFGLEQNRSDKANELLDELAALNLKVTSGKINEQEAKRHKELKTLLQPVLP